MYRDEDLCPYAGVKELDELDACWRSGSMSYKQYMLPCCAQVKQTTKTDTPASAMKRERSGPVVKVIQLPRANNISIMLTQVCLGSALKNYF